MGLGLLLPGAGLLLVGARGGELTVALPGGILSFLGVVVLAQRALPPVVALAGRVLGRSVPARLAAGNATRTPRRTAATATALLIGVTLTTAMVVGAASTRATATAGLDSAYPTDVVVDGGGDALPAVLLGQLLAVDGVAAGAPVVSTALVGPQGPVRVEGLDAASLGGVLRSADQVPVPTSNQVLLPRSLAQEWSVTDGDEVTLSDGDRARTLQVAVSTEDDVRRPRVSADTLAGIVPGVGTDQLWLRLVDGVDPGAVVDRVSDVAGTAVPMARVEGLASERAALNSLLDALLVVVTALLGVAVLVAGVAAAVGVLLGTVYGLAGAASVLGQLGPVHLALPWGQLTAIVVVATLAGLAASVLPARKAARTPPVAAFAA